MKLEISDEYAMDLAYFCKRVTDDDLVNRSHGETLGERLKMAARVSRALDEIEQSLRKAGYSPR